jgi:hypothetical protein
MFKALLSVYRHEIMNEKFYQNVSIRCAALANKQSKDFFVTDF